jgi:hypothetical protein
MLGQLRVGDKITAVNRPLHKLALFVRLFTGTMSVMAMLRQLGLMHLSQILAAAFHITDEAALGSVS